MLEVYGSTLPLVKRFLQSCLGQFVDWVLECCGRQHPTSVTHTPLSMTKRKLKMGMPTDGRYYFAIQWTMVATGSAIGAFIAFGYK